MVETTDNFIVEREGLSNPLRKANGAEVIDLVLANGKVPVPANNIGAIIPRGVVDSRAGGMLTNGTGLLGSVDSSFSNAGKVMYNFEGVSENVSLRTEPEVDGNLLDGVGMGFTVTGGHAFFGTSSSVNQNEIIAVNAGLVYRGSGTVVANPASVAASQKLYVGHTFLDLNGLAITASQHQHFGFAKLAQTLNLGTDTWLYIYRDDAINPHTEWIIGNAGANPYALRRGICIWDHCFADQKVDENGADIPFTSINSVGNPAKPAGFGYSRHHVRDLWENNPGLWEEANDGSGAGNWNGHSNVWRHPIKLAGYSHSGHSWAPTATASAIPEGAPVSHNWHGGTYKYTYCIGTIMSQPEKFMRYEGWVGGVDLSGTNRGFNFPPATAGCNWMMLSNYAASTTATQTHSALSLVTDTGAKLIEVPHGALPEHSRFDIRKVESDGSSAVSTAIGSPRITYGNRPVI